MLRFDGAITGLGTTSGTRLVVGLWPSSPFGPIYDAMVERPDGHRVLIAPSAEVAEFIAATYHFDEIRVEPVRLSIVGDEWSVESPTLRLTFRRGRRSALGMLLALVPRPLARARWWATAIDPIARVVLPGVRTRGTAGGGRREWYSALALRRVSDLQASWEGADLGSLRPVDPPVRFGFSSTPARPSWTRVTTLIDLGPGSSA